MKNNISRDNFWDSFPLVSGLVIAATIFMFLGFVFDPNKTYDNSFFNLVAPGLDEIRNGHYLGLLTSSLIEPSIVFLVWGIGWIWHFGKTIENHVNIFFYIFLIISSIIFSELFEILIFQKTGYGLGGVIYALFGFTWFMSVYEPTKWSVSYIEKISFITFIFLCILVDYTGVYKVAIAGVIGGFIWGVFVGLVLRLTKIKILQISIPMFVFGVFLVPVFWAPWQSSWLLNEAEKYEKQNKFEEAKELYSTVLKKDSENKDGKEGLISILSDEAYKCHTREEFEKAKELYSRILEIDPDNKFAKDNLKIIRVNELAEEAEKYYDQKDYKKATDFLNQILEIDPDNEFAKDTLDIIPAKTK